MTLLMDKYFPVLDHGFVALKDYMGSDEDIEQAARISYGKGTRKKTDTRNLIRYLLRNRHTSPFEMCEIKLHVRVPMDCWRQWIRHRTASVNEYSSRYSEVPFFCKETPPGSWRLQATDNKQGSDGNLVVDDGGAMCGQVLTNEEQYLHKLSYRCYQHRLEAGVAREQARKDLPLSTYTEAFWKIDLHNLLHFLKLRCDTHAQLEIRSYANTIAGLVRDLFPITFEAWQDYSFNAVSFSAQERQLLSIYTSGYPDAKIDGVLEREAERIGLSNRELKEFFVKVDGPLFELPYLDVTETKNYEDFYPKG